MNVEQLIQNLEKNLEKLKKMDKTKQVDVYDDNSEVFNYLEDIRVQDNNQEVILIIDWS